MWPSSCILAPLFLLGQGDSSALASTKMLRGVAYSTTAYEYDNHNLEMNAADDIDQNRSLATDGKWQTITYDGFENGWGTFQSTYLPLSPYQPSGGKSNVAGAKVLDTSKGDNAQKADKVHTGHGALRLKCHGEVIQRSKHDVSLYSKLRLTVSVKGDKPSGGGSSYAKIRYQRKGSSKWKTLSKMQIKDITKQMVGGDALIGGEYTYQTFTVEFDEKGSEVEKVKLKIQLKNCISRLYVDDVKFEGLKQIRKVN